MTERLHRVAPGAGGYRRRGRGRGFEYLDPSGDRVEDEAELARIRALVIPPAWTDVWICGDPRGHLQATGRDAAGRLQYRYHDVWRRRRDRAKYHRMERFAHALPDLRSQVVEDLRQRGLTRPRVLACAVRILDRGALRIGGEEYARRNGSFGLATMRKDHVTIRRDAVELRFTGKSGAEQVVEVVDGDVATVLRSARRHPAGEELLAFHEAGTWSDVRAADINDYLRSVIGDAFSAKDFRTWRATVLASVFLRVHDPSQGRSAVTAVVRAVAEELGNTPAVARNAYIDPRVLDRFLDEGVTIGTGDLRPGSALSPAEGAVLRLLEGARDSKGSP